MTRTGADQFAATAQHAVLYPSRKSLVVQTWEADAPGRRRPTVSVRMAMVDGSASAVAVEHVRSGYERGDGFQMMPDGAVHFVDTPPALHTLDGVRGRDVE
jgi:hypothetical protein